MIEKEGFSKDDLTLDVLMKSKSNAIFHLINDSILPSDFLASFLGPKLVLSLSNIIKNNHISFEDYVFIQKTLQILDKIDFNNPSKMMSFSIPYLDIRRLINEDRSKACVLISGIIKDFFDFVLVYKMEWNRCHSLTSEDLSCFLLSFVHLDKEFSQKKETNKLITEKAFKKDLLNQLYLTYPLEFSLYKDIFTIQKLLKL